MGHNRIYVAHGDLTQLQADAVAYSTSAELDDTGNMFPAFERHLRGFAGQYRATAARNGHAAAGDTFWLPLDTRRPRGVVVVVALEPGGDVRELSRLAVRGAIEVAGAGLRGARGDQAPLLIALPTFPAGPPEARPARVELARAQVE